MKHLRNKKLRRVGSNFKNIFCEYKTLALSYWIGITVIYIYKEGLKETIIWMFFVRSHTVYTINFDILWISSKTFIHVCKQRLFNSAKQSEWKFSKVGIDQCHKQNSMLIKIDGGIMGNLIKMWGVSDPTTGKILRDANRTLRYTSEGIF